MLFNVYHNLLSIINQWLEVAVATFYALPQLVKIRIKESNNDQQYFRQRNRSALKVRR